MDKEKNEFGKFLKNYLDKHEYKLEAFADRVGYSFGLISHYIRGRRSPSYKFIKDFFQKFPLSEDEKFLVLNILKKDKLPEDIQELEKLIISKNQLIKQKPNVIIINEELIQIPIIAKASAGNGYLNFEESTKTISIRKNGFDENCYLIEVEGDSMEPLIRDGAYIVVDPRETEIIDNKIYVVEFEEQAYIKKVIKNEQLKVIILKSINPEYDDIYIQEEKIEDFKVKGRAIKFILEGKL